MTIFDEVKELVDVPTAARCYGVEVHRGNMALCPFHRERHPSCKLYADHYYCFGCQAHGDVIKLVQELFGLKPIEAVKQINSDFALGLDLDKPPDMEKVNRRRREIAERKAEKARVEHMYDVLLRYFTLLDKYKMRYAPQTPDEETDKRFVYALQNIGYAEYMLETFNRFDKEQQEEIKTEVDRIEREYKRCIEEWGEW
ncbi:CHC2 zinc finger domain-containing protein [uncultured Ruminococcus sp.]|uniref:CHC2 zinc finger domain-containing protein n=1 Tax=uncultured Ruminococcus sp. TaxID=165186 RepID=UPI0025F4B4BD|nr:CHC2 zinc finger domain-containing protein [uncultured Ruminococcus sp.]